LATGYQLEKTYGKLGAILKTNTVD